MISQEEEVQVLSGVEALVHVSVKREKSSLTLGKQKKCLTHGVNER